MGAVRRGGPGQPDEDARLAAFFQAYLDEAFRAEPLMATRLGDHRFDDRLDDLSPEARAANVERDRRALAELPSEGRLQDALAGRADRLRDPPPAPDARRSGWPRHFQPFEDDPRSTATT